MTITTSLSALQRTWHDLLAVWQILCQCSCADFVIVTSQTQSPNIQANQGVIFFSDDLPSTSVVQQIIHTGAPIVFFVTKVALSNNYRLLETSCHYSAHINNFHIKDLIHKNFYSFLTPKTKKCYKSINATQTPLR
jgi:hypothetical protein